jgi:flagellar hook-associated protein 1
MGNLFSALGSAGDALKAFQSALDVTQNNVTNANTPGYAKQVPGLDSLSFQPENGLLGGVKENTQDTRNEFAETAVRQQTSLLGQFQQLQTSLAPLQNVFDVSATSPIPTALNQLFQLERESGQRYCSNRRAECCIASIGRVPAGRQATRLYPHFHG